MRDFEALDFSLPMVYQRGEGIYHLHAAGLPVAARRDCLVLTYIHVLVKDTKELPIFFE